MIACQPEIHGHVDPLHIYLPLFNFVMRGAFTNHGNHPACLSREVSGWTYLQCLGDRGTAVAYTLVGVGSQDSCLANADSLSRREKVTLLAIVVSDNFRCKLGTFYSILTELFGYAFPYVGELKEVVDWEASN